MVHLFRSREYNRSMLKISMSEKLRLMNNLKTYFERRKSFEILRKIFTHISLAELNAHFNVHVSFFRFLKWHMGVNDIVCVDNGRVLCKRHLVIGQFKDSESLVVFAEQFYPEHLTKCIEQHIPYGEYKRVFEVWLNAQLPPIREPDDLKPYLL
jgi:hypothetical protein